MVDNPNQSTKAENFDIVTEEAELMLSDNISWTK